MPSQYHLLGASRRLYYLIAVVLAAALALALPRAALAWHGSLTCATFHYVGAPVDLAFSQNGRAYRTLHVASPWEDTISVPRPPGYGAITVVGTWIGDDSPYTYTTTYPCGYKPIPLPPPAPPSPPPAPSAPPVVPPAAPTQSASPPRPAPETRHVVVRARINNLDPLPIAAGARRGAYRLTHRCVPTCPRGASHAATKLVLRVRGRGPLRRKRWFVDGHRIRATNLVHVRGRVVVAWFYDTEFWAPGLEGDAAWRRLYGWHTFTFKADVRVRAERS